MEAGMQRLRRMKRVKQGGLFDMPEHLKRISKNGDPLEVLASAVDFEVFRPVLEDALGYSDGAKGGRPPYVPVAMFKILLLQAQNDLSDARTEFLIKDRLSLLRFLGFGLNEPTPDENTIRHFRNRLTAVGAIKPLFDQLDAYLRSLGYLPMGGQIVDATLVQAPRQRMTQEEKDAAKAGKTAAQIWPDEPAKTAQKDTQARWTVKFTKAKERPDGTKPPVDIAIPTFGYKDHIAIDGRHGFIRSYEATPANAHDGAMLREIVSTDNLSSEVYADTAYRSKTNEAWLKDKALTSRIHQKKPQGKPMPSNIARANAKKSIIRARVEHVFAVIKHKRGLFIRTIGLARARTKIGIANIAYNMARLVTLQARPNPRPATG
jgi:IS5 family transposase